MTTSPPPSRTRVPADAPPPDVALPGDASPDVASPDAPSPDASAAPCTETVASVIELVAAVGRLGPGRVLCLAPGRYVLAAGARLVWRVGDAGISLLAACGARVYHNTLWGNGYTPDVRRFAREVRYQNNLLDQAIRFRDGTMAGVTASNNVALPTPGEAGWFADPTVGDFHLRATATAAIDRGVDLGAEVPTDFEGDARPRGAGSDLGADER